tara:strand:- start:489 stop:722 length:234 start_codon:yes stop_codon:yes gene_type:complete
MDNFAQSSETRMTPENLTTTEAISILVDVCKALEWEIVIPDADHLNDADEVHGVILGKVEYIKFILAQLPESNGTVH